MAFKKTATLTIRDIKPLNNPKGWDIYNLPNQIKTASIKETEDLGGFDIKQATKDNPEHLYIKIFAIEKDEPNDNGDAFNEKELKLAAPTFIGVPLFTNHQNDDVEKARGDCVHAWYDKGKGGIFIIGRVDKVAYPELARGIEEGYIRGTSMGCSVEASICSVCHNKAHTSEDYCFEGKTPVLMSDFSIKNIEDIQIGDNVIDGYGKITEVTRLFKRKVDEKISILKSRCINGELLVTNNHPILTHKRGEYRYTPVGYIDDNETLLMPIPQIQKDNYFFEKFGFNNYSSKQKEKLVILLGYYASEGCRVKRDGKIKAIDFTFHEDEINYAEELIDICIDITGKKPQFYKSGNGSKAIHVRLWGPEFAQKIHAICPGVVHRLHNKKFDESIFTLEDKYKVKLLKSFIDGDGHCDSSHRIQIVSASPGLASQLLYLLLSLKSSAAFGSYKNSGGPFNRNKTSIIYRLSLGNSQLKQLRKQGFKCSKASVKVCTQSKLDNIITDDNLFTKHRCFSVEEISYNGFVYNIETESHSYVANNTSVHNCDCVKERKNRKFSGVVKCKYHDSPIDDIDEKCPLCGSIKEASKEIVHSNQKIFEYNYGLKFIENSFVVNPACHDCGVSCILHVPEVQKKVASLKKTIDNFIKQSSNPDFVKKNIDNIRKIGGVKELNILKESMEKLERVAQSMMKQKDNVSYEYVSDIVKVIAEIQEFSDELTEMGYGQLPSPPDVGLAEASGETPEPFPSPVPEASLQSPPDIQSKPGGFSAGDMSGLGTITKPKFSSENERKIKDISIEKANLNKISGVNDFPDEDVQEKIRTGSIDIEPVLSQNNILEKGIGENMTTNKDTKTAASEANQESITEKQLLKKEESLHPQTDEVYEGITESKQQVGGSERVNDTTSDSPQVRLGTYDTITEDQLETVSAELVRFNNTPDVITEKQWTDMSNLVSNSLPDNYTESITQKQIRDLLATHKFTGDVDVITEGQLQDINMTDGLQRWANKNYTISLMKTATQSITDAIANFRKSPEELSKVARSIIDDDVLKNKVAFLTVVNAVSQKKEARKAFASNASYFNKKASLSDVSTMDALITCVADNAQFGQKAEDILEYVAQSLKNKKVMAKVDEMVEVKLSSKEDVAQIDKFSAFESAVKAISKPEDGLYKIKATVEDVGVPLTNKTAFYNGVKKLAQEMIDNDEVAAAVIKVEVGDNGELIIDIQDGGEEVGPDCLEDIIEEPVDDIEVGEGIEVEEISENEVPEALEEETDACLANARKEIVKEAQMMGGEMGGQGGAGQGPGAGATMPAAPGMPDAAPMETFTGEEGFGEEEDMEEEKEAMPPGSICPACGSEDVDVIGGRAKCNSCGADINVKIELEVKNWPGITPEKDETGEDEFGEEGLEEGLGEFGEGEGAGEGFEMPEETPAMAASMKITPEMLTKLAETNVKLGSVSPVTGSQNTVDLENGSHICLDTGTKYKVSYVMDTKAKSAYGQWEWAPKTAGKDCPSCSRMRQKLVKALATINMSEQKFSSLSFAEKIKTIAQLKEAGAIKEIKTASKDGSVIQDYKVAFGGFGDKFPIENCIEKLARRFGQNALALSGPCEGKQLADCVCNKLKNAGTYTDKLAIKIAESWSDMSGDEECVTDQVRSGYSLRDASSICDVLKLAVADNADMFMDELENNNEIVEDIDVEEDPMEVTEEIDPFDEIGSDIGSDTVSIELPMDMIQKLDEQLDVALGENPAEEEHHEELPIGEGDPLAEGDPIADPIEEGIGESPLGDEISEEIAPSDLDETSPCDAGLPGMADETAFQEDLENNKGISDGKVQISVNGVEADSDEYNLKEASNMKSRVAHTGQINMDLSAVADVLNKKADSEIKQEKAQDSSDIGSYTAGENGSQMGHENETIPSAVKPSVPRDNATMGQESTDLNPQDKPQPQIPSADATMGHEKEVGLSGGDDRYTGGDKGQGKTDLASVDDELYHMKGFGSSKSGLSRLAEAIKNAGEKKLEPKAPVADDSDIQPIKGNSTIGNEEKFDAKEPTDTEGSATESLIGHENETLEGAPKSPADHPDVATGDAQMGKEELDSEKTTKDKGTVIAQGNSQSEAYRVAGRMLESKMISASELQGKVNELKTYKPAQIKDFEKSIFAGKKGLDSVSDGLSQPIQINENSSMRNASEDLSTQLSNLFSLEKQNKLADGDDTIQLRRSFGKN